VDAIRDVMSQTLLHSQGSRDVWVILQSAELVLGHGIGAIVARLPVSVRI